MARNDLLVLRRRRPRPWVVAVGGVLVAWLVLSALVNLWTDYLWFSSVNQADTWQRMWSTKLTLLFAATPLVFVVISVSLLLAERIAPLDVVFAHDDPVLAIRSFSAERPNASRNSVAGIFALALGPITMSYWQSFTLFRYGDASGPSVPGTFDHSLGYFLFRYPFLRSISGWLFAVLVVALLLTIAALYLNGSIRTEGRSIVVSAPARKLLSGLFAVTFLVRAFGFWLSRHGLALSSHERFDGMNYVDRHVRSPGYQLLFIVSIIAALFLLFNVFRGRWDLLISVVVSWVVVAPVCLLIVPAVWQRLVVSNERDRERLSIQRHIGATRTAFQLDRVKTRTVEFADPSKAVAPAAIVENPELIAPIRLWDVNGPSNVARETIDSMQKGNPKYSIGDVDVIPGLANGKPIPVLSGVRELLVDENSSWVNQRLTYTHGFGVVQAPANLVVDGLPEYALRGLPVQGTPKVTQPRIYFGEQTSNYVIVNSATRSLDIAGDTKPAPTFTTGGIRIGSAVRRFAFALKYRDLDLLLSKSITPKSQLLMRRQVLERVHTVAPFLQLDTNPYAVVHNGRIVWVVDAYVTSMSYPNADRSFKGALRAAGSSVPNGALSGRYSYVRNSIRVIVDARVGTVQVYRFDRSEPISAAYEKAFPFLFEAAPMEASLVAKLRYPSDLFQIRANLWGRFHVGNADTFYEANDRWTSGTSSAQVLRQSRSSTNEVPLTMQPEYVVADVTGEGKPEFAVQQSLVARTERSIEANADQRLRALLFARSTPDQFGDLVSIDIPASFNFDGAASAGQLLSASPEIAEQETLLGQANSEAVYGEMQIVPIGNALLYVRPMYSQAENRNKRRPQVAFVQVKYGKTVGFAKTFREALREAVGVGVPTSVSIRGDADTSSNDDTVDSLLARAEVLYRGAQESLRSGELGEYQRQIDELGRVISQARELSKPGSTPSSSATSSSSTSPTTTTTSTSKPKLAP